MRENANYIITKYEEIGKYQIVFGEYKTLQKYATWEYNDWNGYYWGHYFEDEKAALVDYHERVLSLLKQCKKGEQLLPL